MTTPEWDGFKTAAVVSVPEHGSRPEFSRRNYDSKGHEKKEPEVEQKEKEADQGFLSKYWMYILMAFIVLPRLFGESEGGQGGQGAPAPAAASR